MTPVVFSWFQTAIKHQYLHQRIYYTMHFARNIHQERLKEENGHTLNENTSHRRSWTNKQHNTVYGAKIRP